MAIPELTDDVKIIQALSTYPNLEEGLTEEQLKQKFDAASVIIKNYLNGTLVPAVQLLQRALSNGDIIGVDATLTTAGYAADAKATGDRLKALENPAAPLSIEKGGTGASTVAATLKNLGITPVQLWVNASPASSFGKNVVDVPNGADYPLWIVTFRHSDTWGYSQDCICRISNEGFAYFPACTVVVEGNGEIKTHDLQETHRMFVRYEDGNAIRFENGYLSGAENPHGAVPSHIWGVKI